MYSFLFAYIMKHIQFKDHPEFKPNLSPEQMFEIGIMGGSYFRPITSPKTKKKYSKEYEKHDFLKKVDFNKYANDKYDKSINKYGVKVGTSYDFWMNKGWINEEIDPYGWIQWYCHFWQGRRTNDDERQIKRWINIVGENGRFRRQLQNKINEIGKNDLNIWKGMRQTLLHWAFDTRYMSVEKKKK